MQIGYARTSTVEQEAGLEAQHRDLTAAGAEKLFSEQTSSVGPRPRLDAALDYLRDGDQFICTKLDRLARSVADLCAIVKRIESDPLQADEERILGAAIARTFALELAMRLLFALGLLQRGELAFGQRQAFLSDLGFERAQSKGIEIAASFSAAAPRFVRADGLRLRQVLTNLAGNAVKFTDRGGVCVTVERGKNGAARFSVIDTGPGVPVERRAAIFNSFEQGDGSHARRFEGAGLGLAISRELVGLMGGELTLVDNPGGGSIFAFAVRLPECGATEPLAALETRRRAPDGTRALIIADSPFEAPAMEARLVEAGVIVDRADGLDSGLEALSRSRKPHVVIVDCALGPGATNRLAEAARESGVKRSLVLFSPFERRAFGQTALKGFDGWPVRARSLFERVAWDFEPAASPLSRLTPPPSTRRALVAEDNDINALITQKALRRLGFEVFRAIDGEEALRLASPIAPLESRPFDIILMDLKMPGLDGYEATRRLRRLEAACGWLPTPIVALTANAFDEKRGSPSAAGFDAFLVKPVEFVALAGTVERVCVVHTAPRRERLRAS